MTIRDNIDKVAKLLDLLDKHIKEEKCGIAQKSFLKNMRN